MSVATLNYANSERDKVDTPTRLTAARIGLGAMGASAALMLALHGLKPDFDPSWRFLSEYATGAFSGLMVSAFLLMALAHAAVVIAVQPSVRTWWGRLGLGLLAVTVVGIVIAGLNPMDLLTSDPNRPTSAGQLHALGTMLGMPLTPVAALLISHSLARQPEWAGAKRPVIVTAHLTWIAFAIMIGAVTILVPQNGGFGPDLPTGWLNRLVEVTYVAWVATISWHAAKLARS